MRRIVENTVIYICTIFRPRLVLELVKKQQEAVEMIKKANEIATKAYELSNRLTAKLNP